MNILLRIKLERDFFAGAHPDFIVIDGPSGDGAVRFGTLPLIHDYAAPQAIFLLDDAFRSEELDVAPKWDALPYLSVEWIRKTGKGILIGSIVSPNATSIGESQ